MEQSFEKAPGIPGKSRRPDICKSRICSEKTLKILRFYILLCSRRKYALRQVLNGLAKR